MSSDSGPLEELMPGARDREVFSVTSSVSGKAETFEDPREAGRAFFLADPAERPSVTHIMGNSARTMARTEIHGVHPGGEPRCFKSLPSSHAPDAAFREGFMEAMETSIKERLGQVATVKESARDTSADTQLIDDLESFAYRAPERAAQLWVGHGSERPVGPVLMAAVRAHAVGLGRQAAVGRTVEGEVSGPSPRASGHTQSSEETRVIKQSKDWER